MTDPQTCAECGTLLNETLGDVDCPTCLFKLGQAAGPADRPDASPTLTPRELSQRLRDFEVTDIIGRGGSGVVYRARQTRLDRDVAIKVLTENAAAHAVVAERFVREARTLAKLHHNNIVTAFDAGEADGLAYLVMQLVEGCDLRTLVTESGPVSPEQAIDWILQTARGLEYAHSRGIVHRDIKPGNLLLDEDSIVRVLDLGLARFNEDSGEQAAKDEQRAIDQQLTGSGYVLGTVDFMAPEQAVDTRMADDRSDIYSLGCTLYYLLTGEAMFEGETVVQRIIARREQEAPPLGESLPESFAELEAVYQRMVARDPEDRQQSMSQVIEELELVRSGGVAQPASSANAQTDARARRPDEGTGRHRSALMGIATAALAALLAFVVYRIQTDKGTIIVRIEKSVADDFDVKLKDSGLEIVSLGDANRRKTVRPGEETSVPSGIWTIQPTAGLAFTATNRAGVELDTQRLIIRRDDQIVLEVKMAGPAAVAAADDRRTMPGPVSPQLGKTVRAHAGIPVASAEFSSDEAQEYQKTWARHLGVPVTASTTCGLTLQLIPPGRFRMGSSQQEVDLLLENREAYSRHAGRRQRLLLERPQRSVTLTKPFYLGTYEVTQQQYQSVTTKTPSYYARTAQGKEKIGDIDTMDFPVDSVTWFDAIDFCNRLSDQEGLPRYYETRDGQVRIRGGLGYRLPTEAEWEFACRAGTVTNTYLGKSTEALSKSAWLRSSAEGHTHAVGAFVENPFGLFDMHGNVWEWCYDWYGQYEAADVRDPSGAVEGSHRVLRGGDYASLADDIRSPVRFPWNPAETEKVVGLRVARTIAPPDPKTAGTEPAGKSDVSSSSAEPIDVDRLLPGSAELADLGVHPNRNGWMSDDQLRLYFGHRPDDATMDSSGIDLWFSERESLDGRFSSPQRMTAVNSSRNETTPSLTADELMIVFHSNRGLREEIWMARRTSRDEPFSNPHLLGEAVNTVSHQMSPHLSRDGLILLFGSSRDQSLAYEMDLWMVTRPSIDAEFQNPRKLASHASSPFLSHDGTILFFNTFDVTRPEQSELWAARLDVEAGRLTQAVPLTPLNSRSRQRFCWLSGDGTRLYFSRSHANEEDRIFTTALHLDKP